MYTNFVFGVHHLLLFFPGDLSFAFRADVRADELCRKAEVSALFRSTRGTRSALFAHHVGQGATSHDG